MKVGGAGTQEQLLAQYMQKQERMRAEQAAKAGAGEAEPAAEDTLEGAALSELSQEALLMQAEQAAKAREQAEQGGQSSFGPLDMERFEQDLEAARKAGEAMKEQAEEMSKILAIFRRISKGDIVPAQDEVKLMEYDSAMYAAAKMMGRMAENEDPKHHKSVDGDEEKAAELKDEAAALASQGAAAQAAPVAVEAPEAVEG